LWLLSRSVRNYWSSFELQDDDIEFLYNYLLELGDPSNIAELATALVKNVYAAKKQAIELQRSTGEPCISPKIITIWGRR